MQEARGDVRRVDSAYPLLVSFWCDYSSGLDVFLLKIEINSFKHCQHHSKWPHGQGHLSPLLLGKCIYSSLCKFAFDPPPFGQQKTLDCLESSVALATLVNTLTRYAVQLRTVTCFYFSPLWMHSLHRCMQTVCDSIALPSQSGLPVRLRLHLSILL